MKRVALLPAVLLGVSTLLVARPADTARMRAGKAARARSTPTCPRRRARRRRSPQADLHAARARQARARPQALPGTGRCRPRRLDPASAAGQLRRAGGADQAADIDGGGQVTIDAGDKGTVFRCRPTAPCCADCALTGSGDSHDTDDSCLDVRGHRNTIEQLVIDNCLFGIDLKQSNDNAVRGNRISSKPATSACAATACACGTATATASRTTRSSIRATWWPGIRTATSIRRNVGRRSRYSIHFMFANNNVVEGNRSTTTPSACTSCTPRACTSCATT
jgi:parallel beta-helix repeat protein